MRQITLYALVLMSFTAKAQPRTDSFLLQILQKNKQPLFQEVIAHPEKYRYQLIYTQIDRNKQNILAFTNFFLNLDSLAYFNPASTVKLPLAILSLEKMQTLKKYGIDKNTAMQFDSAYPAQKVLYRDSSAENKYPSIAQFIKKAFLVSDNDAYNRMYEFVGQQTINRRLHEMGHTDLRITRQFQRMTAEENRHTNPIRFIKPDQSLIYFQPPAYNPDPFDLSHINKMGEAYYDANDSLVHAPIDFTAANNMTLVHLQQILQAILFPQSFPAGKRFRLAQSDYDFLYRYLSQYPSETAFPKYDTLQYYDSYVKFFFRDSTHRMPANIRVFNKVGWAYGCLTDVSYVADFEHHIEYMLTATIYVNSDGVLNDDKYDYETIGWPFLYQLGQTIYQYELNRPRKITPDLSQFRLGYEKRKEDGRPALKAVDN
ncbi:MAG: hypothetical protein RLZZ28_327 [Bacteroidota bacterium]